MNGTLPKNPAGLTDRHLQDTRRHLLRIVANEKHLASDRVKAAKEIRLLAGDVFKWCGGGKTSPNAGGDVEAPETPKTSALSALKVVG